tara:strand:- start:1169 stop:1678 length:510 start_codon:yes stop_codon:yes gene_type:complete
MKKEQLLALFRNDTHAALATEKLENIGVSQDDIEIMTGAPYPEGAFGEHDKGMRLYVFPFIGAICGLTAALLLTIGTQMSYPLVTGGKPILALPAMAVICYEGMMLGAILFTVIGIIFESRLPRLKLGLYDERITEGYVALLVNCDGENKSSIEKELSISGANEIRSEK